MRSLSDGERLRIYGEYKNAGSAGAAAAACGVSVSTVRRIVREERIRETALNSSACAGQTAETDFSGVDGFLRGKQKAVLGLISKYLAALSDDERLEKATMPQIASAMTTLMEKFTLSSADEPEMAIDPLSKSFMELAARLEAEKERTGSETSGSSGFLSGEDGLESGDSDEGSPFDGCSGGEWGLCGFGDADIGGSEGGYARR